MPDNQKYGKMKKFTILIPLLILSITVFSQKGEETNESVIQPKVDGKIAPGLQIDRIPAITQGDALSKKAPYSGAYNFLGALINSNFGNLSTFISFVYPDSIFYIGLNQGTPLNLTVRYLSIGSVFDPTSEIYQFGNDGNLRNLNEYNPYTIDSVSFPFLYYRPQNFTVEKDTVYNDTFVVDFRVDGEYIKNFSYMRDTSWNYDTTGSSLDSSAKSSLLLELFENKNKPLTVTSSQTVWPEYYRFYYDSGASRYDSTFVLPDSSLVNSRKPDRQIVSVDTTMTHIVDTLIFQFYGNTGAGGVDSNTFTGSGRKFGTVFYNRNTKTGALAIQTDTVLLDENDTATFPNFRAFSFPVDQDISADGLCAATVSFLPGYSFDVTDTLVDFSQDPNDYKLNHFRVVVGRDDAFTAKTYNHALMYLRDQRSGQVGGYFATRYYPGNGFINTQTQVNLTFYMDMTFYLTTENLSIEDSKLKEASLKVFPNPASYQDKATVGLDLKSRADVKIDIYNVVGSKVKKVMKDKLNAGKHTVEFTSDLQPGVYFLDAQVGNQTVTRKFTVIQ